MNKLIILLLLIGVNNICYAQGSADYGQDKLISRLLSQQVDQQSIKAAKAIGFLLPFVAPNNPTAFLRIAYTFSMLVKSDVA